MVWIDKPTGMLSVPGLGDANQDCVVRRVAQRIGDWVREAHRLDQDTSGVMVLARDRRTHSELMRQFREREVRKRYEAVVLGRVDQQRGRIELPIRLDPDRRPRQVVDHRHGKAATTIYSVLGRAFLPAAEPGGSAVMVTRLRLVPLTGRTHQLRVHLAAIGFPILGDDLYATPEALRLADRLMLHATRLEVVDPAAAAEAIGLDSDDRPRLVVDCPCPF